MSAAAAKPESTAVAKRDAHDQREDLALRGLDPHARREVLEQRMRRQITQAIANESWGQSLSPNAQRAVAAYMQRFNLDVGEVEILGGRLYRNGQHYKRRLAEMRSKGLVEWTKGYMIGPDPALDAAIKDPDPDVAEWAKQERRFRIRERIRWAVPPDATHAYVAQVKLTNDANVLEGCDWITPKRTKKTKFGEKIADPVGAEEPEKTVITRAWRRAGILAAAEIPELKAQEETLDAGAVEVAAEVEQIAHDEEAREAAAQRPKNLMPGVRPDDPYALDDRAPVQVPREVRGETAEFRSPMAVAMEAALTRDPYDDHENNPPGGDELPFDADPDEDGIGAEAGSLASPAREPLACELYEIPAGLGPKSGRRLGGLSTVDLDSLYRWAKKPNALAKFPDLAHHCEALLEARRLGDAPSPEASE